LLWEYTLCFGSTASGDAQTLKIAETGPITGQAPKTAQTLKMAKAEVNHGAGSGDGPNPKNFGETAPTAGQAPETPKDGEAALKP
jgi:hypothetical protein